VRISVFYESGSPQNARAFGFVQLFYDVCLVRAFKNLKNGTDNFCRFYKLGHCVFRVFGDGAPNRLGYSGGLELGQLKIMQEVVTLCVFVPFAFIFMGEKWRWDYLWAFFCLVGAVYFVFRGKM